MIRAAKEQRLAALSDAVAAYVAKFGEISPQELTDQARSDARSAVVFRGRSRGASQSKRQG